MTDDTKVLREQVAKAICYADAEIRGWDKDTSWSNWRERYLILADAVLLVTNSE